MDHRVTVVSRQLWGAVEPRSRVLLKCPSCRVIMHHTAFTNCNDRRNCVDQLAKIQTLHMNERGFDDIGYNFLVGGDGTVYEGRGWGVVGAHTKGHNDDSLGVAFMGNFNNDTPAAEAILAVRQLLLFGVSQAFLHPEFELLGHRDVGKTECPGEKLYALLPTIR
ncbi:peptidoglycan recognition protein 5 [Thalassophryne amazonica]|uniref:peptidoglycan recognition protein 5 n=1 Tax=Thalassophryne amazonica TaxID=390379 RepID=UPI001470884E|nr:peptidoglycan recognition protein 5 [Thalassophryne amazonica]